MNDEEFIEMKTSEMVKEGKQENKIKLGEYFIPVFGAAKCWKVRKKEYEDCPILSLSEDYLGEGFFKYMFLSSYNIAVGIGLFEAGKSLVSLLSK